MADIPVVPDTSYNMAGVGIASPVGVVGPNPIGVGVASPPPMQEVRTRSQCYLHKVTLSVTTIISNTCTQNMITLCNLFQRATLH